MDFVRTRKAAAKILGVTDRQLGNWVNEPWFPKDGKTADGWNVVAIAESRDAAGLKGSPESGRLIQIKTERAELALRRDSVRTQREEREEEVARGDILPRGEMTIAHVEATTRARDRLLSEIPRELAKRFPERRKKIFDVSTEVVATCLEQLARDLEQIALEQAVATTKTTDIPPEIPPPTKKRTRRVKKKAAKKPAKKRARKRPKKKR